MKHYTESAAQLVIEGPDAKAFLHRLTSNDVLGLSVGQGQDNALLDRKGHVLSLFYLFHPAPELFILTGPRTIAEKTLSLLSKMKFRERLTIRDETASRCLRVSFDPPAPLPPGVWTWAHPLGETPRFFVSWPLPPPPPECAEMSPQEVEILRIRARFPLYGVDIDDTHCLLESPVPVAYRRGKGCYPGQEVIERISSYGKGRTPRTLSLLIGRGRLPLSPGDLKSGDEKAGRLTSWVYDERADETLALGYVEQKYTVPMARLDAGGYSLILQNIPN